MKKIIFFLILLSCITPVHGASEYKESYYQKIWCDKYYGKMEYTLPDRCRIDCLTKNYAVEFDYAHKWAEAVGQSIYYAKRANKKPAIVLIIEKSSDFRFFYRAQYVTNDLGITLWYMKSPNYVKNYTIGSIKYIVRDYLSYISSNFK